MKIAGIFNRGLSPQIVNARATLNFELCARFRHHRDVGITVQQFNRMKERLGGSTRAAAPLLETGLRRAPNPQQIILGVDPSLRRTGYGVIHSVKSSPRALTYGGIACPAAWPHSRCLVHIAETLRDVIRRHRPAVCVIEGLFYAQNLQTALTLGEARGAALSVIAEAGIEIYELAPRRVKQAIVGYGAAQKSAVAKMVQRLLNLAELPDPDAADALALALVHAQETGRYSLNAPKRI
jgi:crossover junction endodeoxyribonuclease RuvC